MPESHFKRVLVPVASPVDAEATARALTGYLDRTGGVAVVTHVIEKAGGAPDKASVEQRKGFAQEIFDVVAERLANSVPVETRIAYGTDVAETIFDVADEADATAIVVTPREGSRWIRLLTGDVALSLVTESDRPVVVLPDVEAIGTGGEAAQSDGGDASQSGGGGSSHAADGNAPQSHNRGDTQTDDGDPGQPDEGADRQ